MSRRSETNVVVHAAGKELTQYKHPQVSADTVCPRQIDTRQRRMVNFIGALYKSPKVLFLSKVAIDELLISDSKQLRLEKAPRIEARHQVRLREASLVLWSSDKSSYLILVGPEPAALADANRIYQAYLQKHGVQLAILQVTMNKEQKCHHHFLNPEELNAYLSPVSSAPDMPPVAHTVDPAVKNLERQVRTEKGYRHRAEAAMSSLREQLDASRQREQASQGACDGLKGQMVALEDEHKRMLADSQQAIEALKLQVTQVSGQRDQLQQSIEALKATHASALQKLQTTTQQTTNEAQAAATAAITRAAELEAALSKLQSEVGKNAGHIASLETQLKAAIKDRDALNAELVDRRKTNKGLQTQNQQLQTALAQSNSALDKAKAATRHLNAALGITIAPAPTPAAHEHHAATATATATATAAAAGASPTPSHEPDTHGGARRSSAKRRSSSLFRSTAKSAKQPLSIFEIRARKFALDEDGSHISANDLFLDLANMLVAKMQHGKAYMPSSDLIKLCNRVKQLVPKIFELLEDDETYDQSVTYVYETLLSVQWYVAYLIYQPAYNPNYLDESTYLIDAFNALCFKSENVKLNQLPAYVITTLSGDEVAVWLKAPITHNEFGGLEMKLPKLRQHSQQFVIQQALAKLRAGETLASVQSTIENVSASAFTQIVYAHLLHDTLVRYPDLDSDGQLRVWLCERGKTKLRQFEGTMQQRQASEDNGAAAESDEPAMHAVSPSH